jgi:hypothetical protein
MTIKIIRILKIIAMSSRQQILFAGKVMIDQSAREPGFIADRVNRRIQISVLDDRIQRSNDQLLLPDFIRLPWFALSSHQLPSKIRNPASIIVDKGSADPWR